MGGKHTYIAHRYSTERALYRLRCYCFEPDVPPLMMGAGNTMGRTSSTTASSAVIVAASKAVKRPGYLSRASLREAPGAGVSPKLASWHSGRRVDAYPASARCRCCRPVRSSCEYDVYGPEAGLSLWGWRVCRGFPPVIWGGVVKVRAHHDVGPAVTVKVRA